MPQIEEDFLPKYGDRGLVAVAVHRGTGLSTLSLKLEEMGITMPIALDMDSEVFRRYRVPDWVFPLNYLIGRDGKVAYVDKELELDKLEEAIVEILDAQPFASETSKHDR